MFVYIEYWYCQITSENLLFARNISALRKKILLIAHIEIGQPCSQIMGTIVKEGLERMHESDAGSMKYCLLGVT